MSVSSSTYAPQIERETNAVIGGKNVSAERSGGGRSGASGGPTVAVVSLVIALRGDAMKRLGLDRSVSSMSGEHILYRNTGPSLGAGVGSCCFSVVGNACWVCGPLGEFAWTAIGELIDDTYNERYSPPF